MIICCVVDLICFKAFHLINNVLFLLGNSLKMVEHYLTTIFKRSPRFIQSFVLEVEMLSKSPRRHNSMMSLPKALDQLSQVIYDIIVHSFNLSRNLCQISLHRGVVHVNSSNLLFINFPLNFLLAFFFLLTLMLMR